MFWSINLMINDKATNVRINESFGVITAEEMINANFVACIYE